MLSHQVSKYCFTGCYTGDKCRITLEKPGEPKPLPQYVLKQIRELFPNIRKHEMFIGGHPVSITKTSLAEIGNTLNANKQSPYLVCEKSDGVRYLLLVARVFKPDLLREPQYQDKTQLHTQCYFISRKGHSSLESFVVDVGVSFQMDLASTQRHDNERRHVVSILDGELIQEDGQIEDFRYLMFDGLVHLGRNICKYSLRQRLESVSRFVECNMMLGIPPFRIAVELKDFFRLTCRKYNVVEFLINKYVKMMNHKYDGLIFNHQEKEYAVGTTNTGYIKWKPEELNTVDFMVVPNVNMQEKYGKRVLDLYVGVNDGNLGRYTRQFYAFTVINQTDFNTLSQHLQNKEQERFQKNEEEGTSEIQHTNVQQFSGSVIAECRYEQSRPNERLIMTQICKQPWEQLRNNLMKQNEQDIDKKAIDAIKMGIHIKTWKILKIRQDKTLPNNVDTVKKIESSIKDNINIQTLIRMGRDINKMAFY